MRWLKTLCVLATISVAPIGSATATEQGWLGLGFRCHADPAGRKCESLVVVMLSPKGPAARAGFREHDVIITIDGKPARFNTHRDALDRFRKFKRGQRVEFQVVRSARRHTIRVVAELLPPESANKWKNNYKMAEESDRRP